MFLPEPPKGFLSAQAHSIFATHTVSRGIRSAAIQICTAVHLVMWVNENLKVI